MFDWFEISFSDKCIQFIWNVVSNAVVVSAVFTSIG